MTKRACIHTNNEKENRSSCSVMIEDFGSIKELPYLLTVPVFFSS